MDSYTAGSVWIFSPISRNVLEGLAYLEDVDDDEPEDRGPAGKEVVGLGHQVCSLQRIATFNPESSAVIIKYVFRITRARIFSRSS